MRPIAPRTGAPESSFAEEQEEYRTLTVAEHHRTATSRVLVTRWTFTLAERAAIAAGEDIYVGALNFLEPMTPMEVRCGPGDWQL